MTILLFLRSTFPPPPPGYETKSHLDLSDKELRRRRRRARKGEGEERLVQEHQEYKEQKSGSSETVSSVPDILEKSGASEDFWFKDMQEIANNAAALEQRLAELNLKALAWERERREEEELLLLLGALDD